jgi:AAA ATPase domain
MWLVGLGEGAPVFVGRVEELAALDAAFERVRGGRPSAVLIGGEAGVGKSRLVSEFAGRARAAGAARVLRGHCLELSAGACRSPRSPGCCGSLSTTWELTASPPYCQGAAHGNWPGCCPSRARPARSRLPLP